MNLGVGKKTIKLLIALSVVSFVVNTTIDAASVTKSKSAKSKSSVTKVATPPASKPAIKAPVHTEPKGSVAPKPATKVATPPAAKPKVTAVPEEAPGIKTTGLDTENKASGNWVLKKQYWEEAQTTFEKIRNINDSLLKKQMDYIDKSADIEKKVDTAFTTIGVEQGELTELLKSLSADIEKERKERGDLSEPEREFLRELKEKQEKIKQLQLDLKAVGELDDTVQGAVKKVSQQIKISRDYENKAWDDFKKIGQILDHVEAHKLFYQVHGYYTSVQKVADYINHGLWSSVVSNANKVGEQLSKISSSIESLTASGVDLKAEMVKFKKTDAEVEKERQEDEERERLAKAKAAAAKKKKKASGGFVTNIWNAISGFFIGVFTAVGGFFSKIISMVKFW